MASKREWWRRYTNPVVELITGATAWLLYRLDKMIGD